MWKLGTILPTRSRATIHSAKCSSTENTPCRGNSPNTIFIHYEKKYNGRKCEYQVFSSATNARLRPVQPLLKAIYNGKFIADVQLICRECALLPMTQSLVCIRSLRPRRSSREQRRTSIVIFIAVNRRLIPSYRCVFVNNLIHGVGRSTYFFTSLRA